MKDPELIDALSPSTYKSRYRKEIHRDKDSTVHKRLPLFVCFFLLGVSVIYNCAIFWSLLLFEFSVICSCINLLKLFVLREFVNIPGREI